VPSAQTRSPTDLSPALGGPRCSSKGGRGDRGGGVIRH
jgi:hypothetical protein